MIDIIVPPLTKIEMLREAMYYLRLGNIYDQLCPEQLEQAADFWRQANSAQILEIYIRMRSTSSPTPFDFIQAVKYCQNHKDQIEDNFNACQPKGRPPLPK